MEGGASLNVAKKISSFFTGRAVRNEELQLHQLMLNRVPYQVLFIRHIDLL